jgi:glycosyltransferase involved in cell wall biosynthesis
MTLRFGIVTPCLNRAATIGDAVRSVLAQAWPAVEHIVVDGCSTDATPEILAGFPHLTVLRERDRNLYDALNKGLARSTGEVIGLLNSDDLYAPGAFAAAAAAFADPTVEMVIGAAEFFAVQDGVEITQRVLRGARAVAPSEANVIGNVTVMNAGFYRRALLDRIGGFDIRFPLAADKDWWLRIALAAPRCVVLPDPIIRYRAHAGSLTFAAGDTRARLGRHNQQVARTRLAEQGPGSAGQGAYRRWHGWATGYATLAALRQGDIAGAWRMARDGLAADAFWPARFLARLPAHWRDRALRG